MRKFLIAVIVLVLVALGIFLCLPTIVDRRMNVVELAPPYNASERARALHDDALLWSRGLLTRHEYGHTDLPRLQAGRVGLQVFSAVTKTPKNINLDRNADDTDAITMLVMAQTPVNGLLAAVLSTEGLHPLEGKLENLDRLFDAGFRITGLTHFTDNEVGGSAHGLEKGGVIGIVKAIRYAVKTASLHRCICLFFYLRLPSHTYKRKKSP
jgi:membrane dipeptidase